jgi:hypothetical protein
MGFNPRTLVAHTLYLYPFPSHFPPSISLSLDLSPQYTDGDTSSLAHTHTHRWGSLERCTRSSVSDACACRRRRQCDRRRRERERERERERKRERERARGVSTRSCTTPYRYEPLRQGAVGVRPYDKDLFQSLGTLCACSLSLPPSLPPQGAVPVPRYSLSLFYWYKRTNTDEEEALLECILE